MDNLYARTVFFASDAQRSLEFFTQTLGFSVDWNYETDGRADVFQVSLLGFELIVNQVWSWTEGRAGHGRVFLGLEDDQGAALRKHILDRRIETSVVEWGRPTLVIRDPDGNELFFWLPENELASLRAAQTEGA